MKFPRLLCVLWFVVGVVSASAAMVRLRNASALYVAVELTGGGIDLHTFLAPGEEKFISRELSSGDVGGTVWAAGLTLDAQLQEGVAVVDGTELALECYIEPDTGALNFVPIGSVDSTAWPSEDWSAVWAAVVVAWFVFWCARAGVRDGAAE